MNKAVEVCGLRKKYGERQVLQGMDFSVQQGEIFALLGVNGAGKTTTLECIEGLRSYDGGRISCRGSIGIQLQSASLPAHIKGKEAIRMFSEWSGAHPDNEMLSALGQSETANRQYSKMSTGQKRRLHLALALLSDPDIVFLDEPTAGLDVEGRVALHDYIRMLKQRGKTIILATHDMAEVESLCDNIAILREGTIAFSGTVPELMRTFGTKYNARIRTEAGEELFELNDTGPSLIALLQDYSRKHAPVLDLEVGRGSLEQHFVKIAGKGEAV